MLLALAGAAGSAHAANFCVGAHPMCGAPNQYAADAAGFQQALWDANNNGLNPGADTVWVGPGVYEPTTTLAVNGASADLQVIGAGIGETVIRQAANNISGLTVLNSNNHNVSVSALTSHLQGWGLGHAFVGTNVDYSNIEAIANSTVGSTRAMSISLASTVSDSRIQITGSNTIGIYATDTAAVSGTDIESTDATGTAIQTGGADTRTIDRVNIRNVRHGMRWDQGRTEVTNTYIHLAAPNGTGINVSNSNNYAGALELLARNVTIVGTHSSQAGIYVAGIGSSGVAQATDAVVFDSLIDVNGAGSETLECVQSGDAATAALATSYVATQPTRIVRSPGCTGSDSDMVNLTTTPATYTFAGIYDHRPTSASPLIDAGNSASPYTSTDEDVDGLSRETDGNNDLTARVDIGAHEYQAAMAPSKAKITRSPTGDLNVGELFSISAEAHEPDGGSVDFAWDFGDGNSDTGNNLQHSYSSPGIYTVTITATDDELETSTTTHEIKVGSQPPTTPTLSCDKTEAIRAEAITCSANGSTDPDVGDDVDYHWIYTGGGTAITENDDDEVTPSATNMVLDPGPTTYVIKVRAVDDNGTESAEVTHTVTINNRMPVVTGIQRSALTGFRGDEFTFQAQVTDTENDVTYKAWNVDDGNGTGTHDTFSTKNVTYTTLGTKTITVEAIDAYDGQVLTGDVPGFAQTTVEVVNRDPQLGALTHTGNLLAQDAQSFSLPATDGDSDPLTYTWNYGDGQSETTGAAGSTQHAYSAPGNYTVTASVADGFGSTVVAQKTITIAARKAVLTLGKPNKSFWARSKGFTLGGKSPYAFIPVTTTEPVTVRITLERIKGGYKKGTRCVKRKAGRKRCNLKLAGSQTIDLLDNSSKLMFGAKWRGKTLAPGTYRVTLTPLDGGDAKSVNIKIVKKKKK